MEDPRTEEKKNTINFLFVTTLYRITIVFLLLLRDGSKAHGEKTKNLQHVFYVYGVYNLFLFIGQCSIYYTTLAMCVAAVAI